LSAPTRPFQFQTYNTSYMDKVKEQRTHFETTPGVRPPGCDHRQLKTKKQQMQALWALLFDKQ